MTLEEVEGVDALIDNLENIEAPSQLASTLSDPLLQKYMLLKPTNESGKRLEMWLARTLDNVLEDSEYGDNSVASETELLNGLLSYSRSAKVGGVQRLCATSD